jgi:hypothetical protein
VKNISYSAWKKYLECPKKYDFHYNQRLRPISIGSPLVFGIAIDEALNALLLGKGEPLGVFRENFQWEKMDNVRWDVKDLQPDLFTDEQYQQLRDESIEYQSWACMRIKGRLLLEAYRDIIYPQIKEVHSVQKDLESRPGVLDAVITLSNYGIVLADHKTSSMPYQRDALDKDTQLALYSKDQGVSKIAYIVLNKGIKFTKVCKVCNYDGSFSNHKTCPAEVDGKRCHGKFEKTPDQRKMVQLIVGDAIEINQKLIEESIADVERGIKERHYPRNLNSCHKMYGKPCPYFNKCWNNNEDGLEYKQKEEKNVYKGNR